MNLSNVVITRVLQPVPDWVVSADITDDAGNVIDTFGVSGTSINTWWNSQSEDFQLEYVRIFMSIMAEQIVSTD
jgi:hypothetical protein